MAKQFKSLTEFIDESINKNFMNLMKNILDVFTDSAEKWVEEFLNMQAPRSGGFGEFENNKHPYIFFKLKKDLKDSDIEGFVSVLKEEIPLKKYDSSKKEFHFEKGIVGTWSVNTKKELVIEFIK